MAIESLRRYILNQQELEDYTGALTNFNPIELIKAEIDIDKTIRNSYEGLSRKHIFNIQNISGSSVTLTTTTATITNDSSQDGYYNNTTIRILEGTFKNKEIAIETSTVSGSTQTLTFFDTQAGLTGSPAIRLYQVAKIPRVADISPIDNKYEKTIPDFIKHAVALQYLYRISEGTNLNRHQSQEEYEVNRDSYRERFGSSQIKTLEQRISPEALDLLASNGLL